MDSKDSLMSLLKTFKKWFRAIFIVCSIAVVGTIIISLMMDNYYKASTTFYAASSDLAKPAPIGGLEIDIEYYGRDEDIDRLLSIANSGEVATRLIDEYKLAEHYEIKNETQKGKYRVLEKFYKLYSAQKNKYDAIEISMEDTDPEQARDIANRARDLVNEIAQRTVKSSQQLQIDKYKKNIDRKTTELDSLTSKIERVKERYEIFDSRNQGEALTQALAEARSPDQIRVIEGKISEFAKGVSKVVVMEQEQREFGLQLSLDKERYKQLLSAKESDFKAVHLIESADIPMVKSRPRRSILVIAAGLVSLFFCLLAAVVVEKVRSINWKAL
ncbi:GumC domain-containing protein [Portibacter marinus]|uniref:hypothetical protein n=1 Tax=Portibacter marinus TaxID=2898660 RepID=UPI001F3E03BB|nr:hypothetical protein [Portibacter marinus]